MWTVEGWIDRSGERPTWSARALNMAHRGNDPGLGNKGGRTGIFTRFPTVEKAIMDHLTALWKGSVPLTLITIRGIIVAMLMDMAPEVFNVKASDGLAFRCSDSFVRLWLHQKMGWSE
ncbi:hypothetical protein PAXRUDRAFT_792843 [Paxillus rubicundulus Ve08.2h10]|uniref:Unplaced genomic scaffold scaffold_4553, whole genome shotgun sequence n=1 Tax=Paxillus rubicundulus Ve08.2h10 TaxID=930991 RepID=A0A0D0CE75_9AGAM|nr:hypothetical protein PAXRUDRAFT_792843 [Paxillus rubicundulus Ve08.2h10]